MQQFYDFGHIILMFIYLKGLGNAAWDLYQAGANDNVEYGFSGAVGGVLRQIPSSLVQPVIVASEATKHVIKGAKNQFVPDAQQQAVHKWKSCN